MDLCLIAGALLAVFCLGALLGWFARPAPEPDVPLFFALSMALRAMDALADEGTPPGRALGLMNDARVVLRSMLDDALPAWRHPRRGTSYNVLTHDARLNVSRAELAIDGAPVTIYVDRDSGRVCVRASAEFLDGRFELLGGKQ